MRLFKPIIIFIVVVYLLCSCISSREFKGDIDRLKDDEVILVGCVELIPALEEVEQEFHAIGGEHYRNRLFFALGDKVLTYKDVTWTNADDFVIAVLGETLYLKQKYSGKLYISTPYIPLSLSGDMGSQRVYLPGPILIEVIDTCKIAYIGRICFYRNIYNEITKIEVRDEFDDSLEDVREIFGEKVDMCRAKVSFIQEE